MAIGEKLVEIIDYFISNKIKSEYTFDGIQFLFKIRLLVAIALSSLLLFMFSFILQLASGGEPIKLVSLAMNSIIFSIGLLLTKFTKDPLKYLPIALYLLLLDVMYFSHPSNVYKDFSVAYYPYLIIAAVIIFNKVHATITFVISLIYVTYLTIYSGGLVVPHLRNPQSSYLELLWLIILSYILVSFYGNLNSAILRLIAKYKDAIIAERTQTLSGSKMTIIAKIAGGMAHEFNNPLSYYAGICLQTQSISGIRKIKQRISDSYLNTNGVNCKSN